MTVDEFERNYAEQSGVTVQWLRARGLTVQPCDCNYSGCEGWQMIRGRIGTEETSEDTKAPPIS